MTPAQIKMYEVYAACYHKVSVINDLFTSVYQKSNHVASEDLEYSACCKSV